MIEDENTDADYLVTSIYPSRQMSEYLDFIKVNLKFVVYSYYNFHHEFLNNQPSRNAFSNWFK